MAISRPLAVVNQLHAAILLHKAANSMLMQERLATSLPIRHHEHHHTDSAGGCALRCSWSFGRVRLTVAATEAQISCDSKAKARKGSHPKQGAIRYLATVLGFIP